MLTVPARLGLLEQAIAAIATAGESTTLCVRRPGCTRDIITLTGLTLPVEDH